MDIRKMTMEQIEGLVSQAQQGELQRGQLRITLQAFQRDIAAAKKALDNMERSATELLKNYQSAGSTRPTPTVGPVPVSPPPAPASPPPPPPRMAPPYARASTSSNVTLCGMLVSEI